MVSTIDSYAVKQIRGPYLRLPEHKNHCSTVEELEDYCRERKAAGAVLGMDLFSGAGGLSLGLTNAGIEVVFGVDHYEYASRTHAAHFPGMSVDWDLSNADDVERLAGIIERCGIDVLAGGPPCQPFSRAGRSGIRHLVEKGGREPHDARRDLWRAYLEVVLLARPKAVVMENVPDMALDDEMFILRSMIEELEQIGYSVEAKIVEAWHYGVPQLRNRLILVALRDNILFTWPEESSLKVTLGNAISDLPEVEGGWRPDGGADGWSEYSGPTTEYQKLMRRGVPDDQQGRVYDHITRPVREDDREAFEIMTPETKYSDLPDHLRRYRDDIFTDKYKRLDENDLSRTITAHIAKDGYSYIHPRQPRTLTVREAARIQSFPDHFRFDGPPSAAFKQIGNAVPPRMGEAIGRTVLESLERGQVKKASAIRVSEYLADWYRDLRDDEMLFPWAKSGSRWKTVLGELLLERASRRNIRTLWPVLRDMPDLQPGESVDDATLEMLLDMFSAGEFQKRSERLRTLVGEMKQHPEALWEPTIDRAKLPALNPLLIKFLELAAPIPKEDSVEYAEEPVIVAKGILRVTGKFLGINAEVRNKQSHGRISIGRLLGMNKNSREAHLALFELAQTVASPGAPVVRLNPILEKCGVREVETDQGALF